MIVLTRSPFRASARLALTAAITLAGGFGAARADLIAYESFSDQPGQVLSGNGGGMGFSGAWHPGVIGPKAGTSSPDNSAAYQVQGTSLTGGLPSLGGRVAALAQYSLGYGVSRDLSSSIGAAGTTVYMSMILRADGTLNEGASGGFFGLLLNASTTTAAVSNDLFIGKTGSGASYGLEDRGGNNSHMAGTSAAIGVSDVLVVKAEFAAAGQADKFTLYVNPTATSMGTGVVKQDSDVGTVGSLTIYSSGAFSLDEVRIGTSLGDVLPAGAGDAVAVPEPASVAMLAIAGLGGGALARRPNRAGKAAL